MLKLLRKKGVSKKILWVIAIIIILSFGVFGSAYLLTDLGSTGIAGTIFGKNIALQEFNKIYQHVRIQTIIRYGKDYKNALQYLNLESETWDRLILMHEAKLKRIKVSDQEIINAIRGYPFFQRDNQFDNLLYNDILSYVFDTSPRDFEESVRNTLKFTKLYEQATVSATISENEIYEAFKKQNEKMQISYVLISTESFQSEIALDESQLQEYYQDHKIDFTIADSINLEYFHLEFPHSPISDNSNTSDEEKAESENQKNIIKETAHTIYTKLLDNTGIKEIAQQNNIEEHESGFFTMEEPPLKLGMSYELLSQIFLAEEGEILSPYENLNGYYIVKVKQKRARYIPNYEEAKEKVRQAILKNAAKGKTQQKAQEYLTAIKEQYNQNKLEDFAQAAKNLNLEIQQTPVFTRGQYLPKIGISRDFQETAFNLSKENKISDVVETPKGFCILHLDEYIPADKKEYEKQKDDLSQQLLLQRRNEIFGDFLSKLRLDANLIDHISKQKQQKNQNPPLPL